MKQRNGFWSKARAERPKIYRRPRAPLFEKHLNASEVNVKQFNKFFEEFVRKTKIPKNPDTFDLHALVAKTMWGTKGSSLNISISREKEYWRETLAFPKLLALAIILRDYLQDDGINEKEATEIAMNVFEGVEQGAFTKMGRVFLYESLDGEVTGRTPDKIWEVVLELVMGVWREKEEYPGPELMEGLHSRLVQQTLMDWRTCSDYRFEMRDLGETSELGDLLGFLDFVSEQWGHKKFFTYPSGGRLKAILGDEFVPAPGEYEIEGIEKRVEHGAKAFAAILMQPWEADHLAKAKEMIKRGIGVAKPIARLIHCGIEFGIFEWVKGEPLSGVEDTMAWEEYGKTLRRAHELGIVLDDAAGRNAIWDGEKITLIDFEHTWFMPRGRGVEIGDQTNGLLRVLTELSRKDGKLLLAFESGYGKQESLLEAEAMLSRE